MEAADIDNRFAYHQPTTEGVAGRHQRVRESCCSLAHILDDLCGEDSREKSLAITHLEETMMWANAAIARHQ